MKKWIKYLFLSVILVTLFSANTASAKNIATAVLKKAEDSNDVSVALELPENKADAVTSLRFKLLAAVEETGTTAFDEASVSFDFAELPGVTKDAAVMYDSEVTDYVIDIILSGKEPVFRNADGTTLAIGTLRLPAGDYYAEVECVAAEDDQDEDSKLQYVDRGGLETMTISLKSSETVLIGKKAQPDAGLEETEPTPQNPGGSEKPQETPDRTEPVPSGPVTGTDGSPGASEPTQPQRPALQPAEPKKNGLSAPKLTVKAVTGTEQLRFSWKAVKGAKGYQIFKYDEATGSYKKQKNVKGTSYTAKYSYGETCRFKVRAYKKAKGSKVYGPFSAEKEVTVSAFNRKETVSVHVTVPAKGKKLHFSWKQVPGADGYQILRYNNAKKQYKVVKTISAADTLECRAVKYKFATDYQFEMRAFAYGESREKVFGAVGKAVSITTPPKQVSGVKVKSPDEFMIKVTWKKTVGADGYFIYRSEPDEKRVMKKIAKVEGNVISYIDKKLEGGAKYYYQVAAFKYAPGGKRKTGERSAVKSAEVK